MKVGKITRSTNFYNTLFAPESHQIVLLSSRDDPMVECCIVCILDSVCRRGEVGVNVVPGATISLYTYIYILHLDTLTVVLSCILVTHVRERMVEC